jgi:hypothetical protein
MLLFLIKLRKRATGSNIKQIQHGADSPPPLRPLAGEHRVPEAQTPGLRRGREAVCRHDGVDRTAQAFFVAVLIHPSSWHSRALQPSAPRDRDLPRSLRTAHAPCAKRYRSTLRQ